jgi:hypothetical protein
MHAKSQAKTLGVQLINHVFGLAGIATAKKIEVIEDVIEVIKIYTIHINMKV